jgi:peptidoglycan hydrolase-like protein with peptidoglycan-binding domain
MVTAMIDTEDTQLSGMANFVRSQDLHVPLGNHDWAGFARRYNGPDFAKNQYDVRLAASFELFSNGALPNLRVRQVQVLLTFLDFNPGTIDGILGKRTRSAIVSFREKFGPGDSDEIDDDLIAALQQRVAIVAAASA